MDKLISVSPLASVISDGDMVYQSKAINIEEVSNYGLIRIQVFSRGIETTNTISDKLNMEMPKERILQLNDKGIIMWSAPGEWIMAVKNDNTVHEARMLSEKLVDIVNSVTIITASRIVLRLCGPLARNLLAKGSGVDFHSTAFKDQHCVTTKFSQIPVMIAQMNDDEFLLFADRSFAVYLLEWLKDAASEFEVLESQDS